VLLFPSRFFLTPGGRTPTTTHFVSPRQYPYLCQHHSLTRMGYLSDLAGRTDVDTCYMFSYTNCSTESRPNVSAITPGPFCFTCGGYFGTGKELRDAVNEYSRGYSLPLDYGATIGDRNVSLMGDFSSVFEYYTSFNEDISGWDVSSATSTSQMFYRASSFNGDLSQWDVSRVTTMYRMFREARAFNGNVSSWWSTSNLRSMTEMFNEADAFDDNLSKWDTSNLGSLYRTFDNANVFTGKGLEQWMECGKGDQYVWRFLLCRQVLAKSVWVGSRPGRQNRC
jgi:surface protein